MIMEIAIIIDENAARSLKIRINLNLPRFKKKWL